MASVRKRKMARSSVKKNTKHTKDKKKNVKITSHPIMAAHWDKKLTLKQNYKNLGLTVRLNKPAGGEEAQIKTLAQYHKEKSESEAAAKVDPESVANETDPANIPEGEARLVRDPETNEVVQIIYGTKKRVADLETQSKSSVIEELQKYSEQHATPRKVRELPEREAECIARLHAKYGDDYEKMRWDSKLNPGFMTSGQLKRKMAIWKATTA